MTSIFVPSGPAGQLANLSFFLAALVSDVLFIRLFLVGAYAWLLAQAALGMPRWPSMEPTGGLALDAVVWCVLCLLFHGYSLLSLLLDERRVRFRNDDEEQLWRFFYRRSGMPRLEMQQVLRHGTWVRVPAGAPVVHGSETHTRFFVLVEGAAELRNVYKGVEGEPRLQYSGCCWDLGLLGVFGIFNGFQKSREHVLSVTAATPCLLYSWSVDELAAMATRCAPAVGAYWRYFALCELGMHFGYRMHPDTELVCATGEPEAKAVLEGARSRDFTDPLRRYESQEPSVRSVAALVRRAFHPFPPPGLRHNSLPITGIMARNRLIALKAAEAAAALQRRAESVSGRDASAARDASARGGRQAYRYLAALQSLRHIDATTVDELLADVRVHGGVSSGGRIHVAADGRPSLTRASSAPPLNAPSLSDFLKAQVPLSDAA